MGWGDRGMWGVRSWGAKVVRALLESALGICLLAPWKSGFPV